MKNRHGKTLATARIEDRRLRCRRARNRRIWEVIWEVIWRSPHLIPWVLFFVFFDWLTRDEGD